MKIIRLAKYYSVNRDDNELRVVICPKCRKSDVKKTEERVRMRFDDYPAKLFQCNSCKTWFSFDPEDGVRDINKKEAEMGIKNDAIDMQDDFHDQHKHSYYIPFTDKPPTISEKEYEKKMWGEDVDYDESKRYKESMLTASEVFNNKEILRLIDWKVLDKAKRK